MDISREEFEQQRHPRLGTANPERMRLAHWEKMVRLRWDPYRLRRHLGLDHQDRAGPDWCFNRMGATRTELADGRVVCVGGEYEDYYDPDFCIYNDVVVLGPTNEVEIFGYPKEIFPPTDFHTATLDDDRLILIGGLGYPADRVPGFTPVYSLELATFRIERVDTLGEGPGWIFKHEAAWEPASQTVTISAGETVEQPAGQLRRNLDEYRYHPANREWERLTDRRGWRQFRISRADRKCWFRGAETFRAEDFRLQHVPHETLEGADWRTHRIRVEGVCINMEEQVNSVRVIILGELPAATVTRVVEDLIANLMAVTTQPCCVQEL